MIWQRKKSWRKHPPQEPEAQPPVVLEGVRR